MLWPVLMAALAAEPLTLLDPVRAEALAVPPGETRELLLPALPPREGHVLLLRFRAYVHTATEGGCNYNGALRLNGNPIGRRTAGGNERLVGRPAMFELTADTTARTFPVFNGPLLMVMFAPTADRADPMSRDGQGGTFLLDISDVARGVDGNVLRFQNRLEHPTQNATGELRVEGIEVGWAPRAQLPQPPRLAPQRAPMSTAIEASGLRLAQGRGGGFSLTAVGEELLVETAVSMAADAPAELTADDTPPTPQVTTTPWGPAGFELRAVWPGLELVRWLALHDGGLRWRERWTNVGPTIRGVPFGHRFFLRAGEPSIRVGGSADVTAVASSPTNPTLFFETTGGKGLGITAESDELRLLLGWRARVDLAEAYTHWLALAPGKSLEFAWSIMPVATGGYWSFINGLRQRWGVQGTMDRPLFWGFARRPGVADPTEQVRQSLGHLGPLYVTVSPWQRLEPDAKVVRGGSYPKLPREAPATSGPSPELDADTFLTFAHRERYWKQFELDVARLREAGPEVRPLAMTHPAMEAVYKPLHSRWPIAGEVIRNADGEPFEDAGYSRAWLGDATAKGWGVYYHVPRPGSAYLAAILADIDRALACGAAGIYCDEFSWGLNTRGYSRYDYSRWDGFSADLDPAGEVLRLKCDNAAITEAAQLQMVGATAAQGRFFLGNGGNVLRSLTRLPLHRFVEGGNGVSWMYYGHLSPVPLVLGNFGDQTSRQGVFEAVKMCLANGAVYSPMAVNLLLEGRDNFVSRQYPLTVTELGPGWVAGRERLITTVARPLPWPAPVKVYRYDATGALLGSETLPAATAVEVPAGGLVIAERQPTP